MKTTISLLSLASFLLLLAACSAPEEKKASEIPAIPAEVAVISNSNAGSFVAASGKIEAQNSANISTRMMGYITALPVKTGQRVSQGQLLVSISNTDLQAKKAQASAAVAQANAAYSNAKKDYDRFVTLYAQKSASQKELDDMTTRYEMAKAGLETAQQMKKEVIAQFAYSNITAPFSGVVTGTFAKAGDMANPGMPLLSLEGESKLQAVVMVPESEISAIKTGLTADVTIKSLNKTIKGKVVERSTSAAQTAGQYLVKIDLENTKDILSGMFVNAVFPVEKTSKQVSANQVLIPTEALISQGQLKGIYIVNEDNVALLRWLRLGKVYGNEVEVLAGLAANEQYVVKADGRLFNGAKIKRN